ncbi:unnamed protein product, partial [Nesidiocoris tenuis]
MSPEGKIRRPNSLPTVTECIKYLQLLIAASRFTANPHEPLWMFHWPDRCFVAIQMANGDGRV